MASSPAGNQIATMCPALGIRDMPGTPAGIRHHRGSRPQIAASPALPNRHRWAWPRNGVPSVVTHKTGHRAAVAIRRLLTGEIPPPAGAATAAATPRVPETSLPGRTVRDEPRLTG